MRRAETSVDLKNGQSFMIAGLLQSENNMINQSIPGLGKLPVLGPLFSSKAYQRRETDLVIIVTPYLVKPIDPSKKPRVPTDDDGPSERCRIFPRQQGGSEGFGRRKRCWASAVRPPRSEPVTSSTCRRSRRCVQDLKRPS